jgi:hypothetical protein
MMTYLLGTTITFSILLNAFLKDGSTAKTDALSWLVVLVGALLWFITLPFIARKKLLEAQNAPVEIDELSCSQNS